MTESIPLYRLKLFEQVAAHIQKEILSGALKPGDRLPPERDLQAKFGVGRPAIREALITLQRSGLIEFGNGAPARVAMPTAEGVVAGMIPSVRQMLATAEGQRQLQGVRLFVEVGLARHAATNAVEADIADLDQALRANEAAIGDTEAFIRTDVAFHFCFAKMMRNPAFIALHEAMSTWLTQQRKIALAEPGEDRRGYEAHAEIFAAVAAHDPNAAEDAMRRHLASGSIAFWRRYEEAKGGADERG